MKSKKLNAFVSYEQMVSFKKLDVKSKDSFIKEFIDTHSADNVSSKYDFYSLLLNCAIIHKDIELIDYVLQNTDGINIFTHTNYSGLSPISHILLHINGSGENDIEILKKFNNFFNTKDIAKNELTEEDLKENIPFLLSHPNIDEYTLTDLEINLEKMVSIVGDIGVMGTIIDTY